MAVRYHALPCSTPIPQELAKFSELAHRWWDPESEFRPLHQINPLRLDWIDGTARRSAGKRVLDVGCGGGILADAMARRGADVLGIDLADKALKVAQLHALEAEHAVRRLPRGRRRGAGAPSMPGAVRCRDLHGDARARARSGLRRAGLRRRSSKPGGWVFFSTINRNPKAFLFAIVGAEYVLTLLPKGTHEYARFIRPSELARWCRDAGLELTRHARHGIQPADAALLAVRRHQRQLPGGVPQAVTTAATRARTCCSISTAR